MPYAHAGQYGPEAVLDQVGALCPATAVTVNVGTGSTPATLYTDQTMATSGPNPVTTSSVGDLVIFAAPGQYTCVATLNGTITTWVIVISVWPGDEADLVSPALTGTPTAPTAAPLTDDTQIATTAYADAAVGVETSRAEAAEALKAPLASPALTGTPTAPTAAALTNSTEVATTAYADAAVAVLTASKMAAATYDPAAIAQQLVGTTAAQTVSGKRLTKRVSVTAAPGATPAMDTDNYDVFSFTGLATAITSMTTSLTGTPVDGDSLVVRLTDNGTAQAITWGAKFEGSTVALPTTTVASAMLTVRFEWNVVTSAWRCIGAA